MPLRVGLLHGFAGDARAWDDVVAAWPRPHDELVAIALPGHGGGAVRRGWSANLDAVAAATAGSDAVVGYSLGARLALGLFATGRASRVALIGVNPGLADAERAARRADDARWVELLRGRGLAAFLDAWEAQPMFASQARVAAARLAARRTRRRALDAEQLAQVFEHMGLAEMPDYRARVAGASLVAGGDDAKYLAIARDLGMPCRSIPGSGHDPTLEQPAALAAALAELLHGSQLGR